MKTSEVRIDRDHTVRVYDNQLGGLPIIWHHASPSSGALPEPLLAAAAARDIRLVSYARPAYGGSDPRPERDVVAAAIDVLRVADALGLGPFAVMGASGGAPHALACAARLGDRVSAAVCLGGMAPFDGDAAWFEGMRAPAGLRAATAGREERARFARYDVFDEDSFTAADWAALGGNWRSLGEDAASAASAWPDGLIDDDVALVQPWGFELEDVDVPALIVHGGEDRIAPLAHSERLLAGLPLGELWLRPRDGHVSVLDACTVAMDWALASQF